MQVWTMRMFAGSGAIDALFDAAPASVPALAAIAAITPAGAPRTGAQITYAPVTHLPPMHFERGVDIDQARAMIREALAEHEERVQIDMRRHIHDL